MNGIREHFDLDKSSLHTIDHFRVRFLQCAHIQFVEERHTIAVFIQKAIISRDFLLSFV